MIDGCGLRWGMYAAYSGITVAMQQRLKSRFDRGRLCLIWRCSRTNGIAMVDVRSGIGWSLCGSMGGAWCSIRNNHSNNMYGPTLDE